MWQRAGKPEKLLKWQQPKIKPHLEETTPPISLCSSCSKFLGGVLARWALGGFHALSGENGWSIIQSRLVVGDPWAGSPSHGGMKYVLTSPIQLCKGQVAQLKWVRKRFKISAQLCQPSLSTLLCCFGTGGWRQEFELLQKKSYETSTINKTGGSYQLI